MGSCISKISKDLLLGLETFMKNKTFFKKGKARPGLDKLTGGTYSRIHSIKGLSKKETFAPLQAGAWWRHLFKKRVRSINNNLRWTMTIGYTLGIWCPPQKYKKIKCFWCIDEIPEAAINRVTCPLRYNPPQEFCTYEVNEKPGEREEVSIAYSINENVSQKLRGKKGHYNTYDHFCSQRCCLVFAIEKKGYDSKFEISYLLIKARYSGLAASHWTNLKDFGGNMFREDFKNNSVVCGK